MNLRIAKPSQRPQKRNLLHRFLSALTILATMFGTLGSAAMAPVIAAPAAVPTNTLTIQVVDAQTSTPISNYKFLINEDNTGDPKLNATNDPGLPRYPACNPLITPSLAGCEWPSVRSVPGAAPIVTQGDETDLSATIGLDLGPYLTANPGATKFLISVVADTYKIGGLHFSLPLESTTLPLVVELVADPLPLATMRIQVFEDNTSPNGQMDAPAELGLNGFEGRISDVLGEISTDWYGNPLCTEYDTNGDPIPGTGGICLSGDTNHDGLINGSDDPADQGLIVIPNIGSGRHAALVVPPNGTDWVQTTTLEGGHDWDTWLQEGATGYDTEFLFAGEPFPWTMFGFVRPMDTWTTGGYTVSGTVVGVSVYIPPQGGLTNTGDVYGGLAGARINGPVDRPYIALSNLDQDDEVVYMQRANANGAFTINNVPNGSYLLTVWDGPQVYLLDIYNVTVSNGNVAMGNVFLTGWFAHFEGSVFIDTNGNGKRDGVPLEKGLAGQEITIRSRGNNLVQHGAAILTTDANGYYNMENGYPFTAWEIMEVYNDRYHTTGVTYQADNQLAETTVLGQGVDVNILPIIGLSGRLDWGVLPYARGENGGIVGTVTYDVTRNELDPRLAAAEDWQPSIPDMTVNLYPAVHNPDGTFKTQPDGSYTKGNGGVPIQTAVTETWERPTDCVALDLAGVPVAQQALPTAAGADCLDAPMMGIQFGPLSDGTNFGASVNGNYGFGDLAPGDYLVEVISPTDWLGNPLFKVTREEDINVFNGDEYTTLLPPPPCAGALHTVDVAGVGVLPDGPNATDNPNFAMEGGSPFEGQSRPLCDVKLVRLQDSRSIAPTFNFFTDVPLPGRFMGYIVDDLTLSTDPRSTLYGEKAGLANVPIGIYDFGDRLFTTIESDPNGLWEVLLPSTLQINCPTPSGVCSDMYRFVGNDPGQPPDQLNPKHNPQYRTITASFEVWPGVINPADLAPTQIAVSIQGPGSQFNAVAQCALDAATPKFFAVDRPNVPVAGSPAQRTINIFGDAFGATQGAGSVMLGTSSMPVTTWGNGQITITVPTATAVGPYQLKITAGNGQSTVNGLTVHVTGTGYNPTVLTVNDTALLDDFNRGGTGNVALGLNWAGPQSQVQAAYRITTPSGALREVQVRTTGANGLIFWNGPGSNFGPDQEASFTFTDVSTTATEQSLVLKLTGLAGTSIGPNTAMIEALYDHPNSQVRIETLDPTNGWVVQATFTGVTFAAGDTFRARALVDGTVNVYKNGALLGGTNLTAGPTPWPDEFVEAGGQIGVWFIGTGATPAADARFDNFDGANVTIQSALTAAAATTANTLVVVYPGPTFLYNPHGLYFENLVMASPAKLQGVGPGGQRADGSYVNGAAIDGVGFTNDNPATTIWRDLVASFAQVGNPDVSEGAVIYVIAQAETQFTAAYRAAIDGLTIQGGDQQGFPTNINSIGGGQTSVATATAAVTAGAVTSVTVTNGGSGYTTPPQVTFAGGGVGATATATLTGDAVTSVSVTAGGSGYLTPPTVIIAPPPAAGPLGQGYIQTQGGGIFVNGFGRFLQISNNVMKSNGGSYGGAIRLGTPDIGNNENDSIRIANNRIIANGGTNLAGAIGLFSGSDSYEIANNDLCGNFSAEYGGAISHYGLSPNGAIHHNRIYFNQSYDEGGGVMISGELPVPPATVSTGTGPVSIYNNLIQSNLGNDDGGGVRVLMANNVAINIYNNFIVNNISTDEGGGIALDTAANVRVYNNTVMNNITTATAATSNGAAKPAGLSTVPNSPSPVLFNNIFWDNRAGSWNGSTVGGIGLTGDATPINLWDMGVVGPGTLTPTNSVLNVTTGTAPDGSNSVGFNPLVQAEYDTTVAVFPWRTNPNLVQAAIIALDLPVNLLGNYHLTAGSPAINRGAPSKSAGLPPSPVTAPPLDFDDQVRGTPIDSGADEIAAAAPSLPALTVLDNFNRANATTLGSNWSQVTVSGAAAIRVNANQAFCINTGLLCAVPGSAYWNVPAAGFGAKQGAALTFASATVNNVSLILKAISGPATLPTNFIRVQYQTASGGQVVVATTTTGGLSYTTRGTFAGTFANGETLSAMADATGTVYVWKTSGVTTTFLGSAAIPGAGFWTGAGRIGIQLPNNTRVDDFKGGTVP